ncbi:MAG: DUF445 family protein [Immundisolibacter sp.]|uniref:DUF445 domain-containing protein n=1 Tax=Immundisolibacter sp. TaxID=1934948 RepID=UPI0019ACAE9F|nr:DUF445 family protein [Immundisolibacter sp.]MBC7161577.1 DUF445 family protein [Immundisolibacter sp.]
MSTWTGWVLPPLIGAVIGGVTNDVAIRMLFRPYRPWRIGRLRVPLTPGLIPRERAQIALAIADTFTAHVLDGEQVADLLLTEPVRARLRDKVAGMVDQLGGLLGANAAMLSMAKGMAGDLLLREIDALARADGPSGEHIRERIRARIDALDVAKLEALVLGFSRRQFRAITWFGVLLGGLIGLVQVLLMHFLPAG